MTIPTGTKLGRYEIRSKLGEGGMGEVYLARDTELDRTVAIKILPEDLASDQQRLQRFIQEAKAASALNHPHILTIYEIGTTGDSRFIATEFINGETLRQRITVGIKITEILEISIQASGALAAAHAAGIIHRDIKPENIMVRPDGYTKLIDFGLAKLTEPEGFTTDRDAPTKEMVHTRVGSVMGTASYMSPEQAKATTVDARTDLWSLGAVLYEMVTGHLPFAGETPTETISLILQKEPAALTSYAHEVPAELDRIVTKALTKDREERYQTAKDLLIDLRNLKRKLEVDAEIDRTAPPELRRPTSTRGAEEPPATSPGSRLATSLAGSVPATSSAEDIASKIKRHKLLAVIVLAALALAGVGLAAYLHAGKADVPIESIAVLPFVNQNNDPNTDYLSDGITESIISSLSRLPQLRVMARGTVFTYKGKDVDPRRVGNDLGVRAVLTGRVIQQGDNLTISTELVKVLDGTVLWGQRYNRKLTDVFALQEEMAREISEKLRLKLTSAEQQQLAKRPTENLKAFQYYMQGRLSAQRRTRGDLLTAISYCEKAIAEDRNYALAYAGLGDAYSNLGVRGYMMPLEGRRKAEEAARKAIGLDENLAEAHVALGQASTTFAPFNFPTGDRELRRGIELSPSLAIAHQYLGLSLARQGRLDEALEECQKARELDPLSSAIAKTMGLPYYLKRDYSRALELLRLADDLGPPFSQPWEIGPYIQNGLFEETLAALEKAKQERKDDPILIYSTGMVYAAQGKRAEGLRIIKELEEMSGASLNEAQYIAKIYATLNEKELALTWLERGLAVEAIGSIFKDDRVWDPIRSDARFADLLRRMGVPS